MSQHAERWRKATAERVAEYRMADRAARDHFRMSPEGCEECADGLLCLVGARLLRRADELGNALPYDALRTAHDEPSNDEDDDAGGWPSWWLLLAAFFAGAALMCAWPACVTLWRLIYVP